MTGGGPLRELAASIERFSTSWPLAAAEAFGAEVTRQVASATGGDGYLSGWRELGTAQATVSGGAGSAKVSASGGAWSVLENGTRPHEVVAKGRALNTPHGPRRRVHVRGRPPMAVWERGSVSGAQAAAAVTQQALGQIGA